jgi:Collagen triple helix repeat (20 copies)
MESRVSTVLIAFVLAVGCGGRQQLDLAPDDGTAGAAGARGSAGTSGTAGTAGVVGVVGSAGVVGTTGVAGSVGAAGSVGVAGAVGVAGRPAVTGAAGATGGAGGGVAPVPFDVSTIPGLVLWVDATRGVTASSNGEVTAWQDQSSARNDLTPALQYPAGYVPTGPGGNAVIRFATSSLLATQDRDLGAPTLGFGTGDVLVEVVWAWSSQVLDQPILFATMQGGIFPSASNQALMLLRPEGSGAVTLTGLGGDQLTSTATLGDTQLHLVGAHRAVSNGVARVELRVDGRIDQVVHGDSPMNLLPSAFAEMGGGTTIAEVIVVKGSISDATLAALESHLVSKYGLK